MASFVRRQDFWVRHSAAPRVLLQYEEPSWEFRELEYAPAGFFDHVTSRLHIDSRLDPIRQRIGSPRNPFLLVPPSAADDHVAASWEGIGRGRHVLISSGFVAAVIGKELSSVAIAKHHFARLREPDHNDTIIDYLMGSLATEVRNNNPVGSVFLQTVATALVHYALQITAGVPSSVVAKCGGLSPTKLRLVMI